MAPEKRALSRTESELFIARRRHGTRPPSAAAAEAPPDPPVAPACDASEAPPATFLPSPAADEAVPAQIAPSPASAAEARSDQIVPFAAAAADATPAHVAASPSAARNGFVPAGDSISEKRALSLTEAELFVARRRRGSRGISSAAAAEAPPVAASPSAAEVTRDPPVKPSPAAAEAPPAQIASSPAAAAAAAESRHGQIGPSASAAAAAAGATSSPVTLSSSAESNVAVPSVDSSSDLESSSDIAKGRPPESIPAAAAAAAPPARQDGDGGRIGRIKRFRKICDLGEGGHGVVSKARDTRTGHVVAIKSSRHPGDGAALLREAALLVACRGNPAVVQLQEVVRGSGEDDFHLVMDFVGRSLHDAICRRRRRGQMFTESETLHMMKQLLIGVDVMGAQGVVHCDLKPENILVGKEDGRLKICDFGLASFAAAPPHDFDGTLWYSAPEQLLSEGNCGPAVDAWALGCIMVELLTGEPLIQGIETAHQLTSIIYLLGVSDEVSKMHLGVDASAQSELRDSVPETLLSSAGFDVLQGLLRFDPTERLTPAAALSMKWFSGAS